MMKLEPPCRAEGTVEQQLKQIYAYLFRLSEMLNVEFDTATTGENDAAQRTQEWTDTIEALQGTVLKTASELQKHEEDLIYPISG